ncbi:MAG: hypothetical protein ACKORJ_07720 [Bacteroidota bacterium]
MKKSTFNLLFILSFIALVTACATAKMAKSPAGSWNFTVNGTPYGEIKGDLTVTANGKAWTARLKSMGEDKPFDQFLFDSKTGKVTGSFYFQGNPVNFDAVVEGNTMKGAMSAGGADFPFSGSRSAQ